MADPPKSDIIKKYPVGRVLDAFRSTYSSVCAELDHSESSDVVSISTLRQIWTRNVQLNLQTVGTPPAFLSWIILLRKPTS
jgi:hypothetical protein